MNKLLFIILAAVAVAASDSPQPRLTGGTPVTIEEFPYIVAYVYFYPGPGIFVQRCVGSLISSFHVLTTAFCFSGASLNNMLIRAGSAHSLQGGILSIIDSVIFHPEYAQAPRKNDIAVTTLSFPLSPSSTIGILYLPPQNWYIPDGQTVQVVSWGFLSESGPQNNYLSTVDLHKLPLDDCKFYYSGSDEVTIDDPVICARSDNVADAGTCVGDSGAPMAIDNVVVGLSSYFKECGNNAYPDVFTRIDRYTNWILEVSVPPALAKLQNDQVFATPRVASS